MKKGTKIAVMTILSIVILGLVATLSFMEGLNLGKLKGVYYHSFNKYTKVQPPLTPLKVYVEETNNEIILTHTTADNYITGISIYTADESGKLISHVDKKPVINQKHFKDSGIYKENPGFKYTVEGKRSYAVRQNSYMPAKTKDEYMKILKEANEKINKQETSPLIYIFVEN